MKIFSLYSPYPRAGKDTVAKVISERYQIPIVKFAEPIKQMITALLKYAGYDQELIDKVVYGDARELELTALSCLTSRKMQQTLGTEWGRMLHPDFWVTLFEHHVSTQCPDGFVVSDMRFPNEYDYIQKLSGFQMRIVRPSIAKDQAEICEHASEGRLEDKMFHVSMTNSDSLEEFRQNVLTLFDTEEGIV